MSNFEVKVISMPYDSKGIVNRVKNLWFTYKNQGDVNHVTGDIHYIVFALPRSKTILTIHDCGTAIRLRGYKLLFFTLLWLKWPVSWVKYVTVISDKTKQDLVALTAAHPDKIAIVPNYIHPDFQPGQLGESEVYNILLVGTARHKNWTRLAQSIHGIPCKLTIIGRLTKVEKAFLHTENVDFVNKIALSEEELREEYNKAHLVFFASLFEGFGMPILEAQAMGRPVLVSDMSPMKWVAGEDALTVNPYDTGQIRNKLLNNYLDAQDQEAIILEGFRNIKRFSVAEVARQYIKMYEGVLR